MYNSYASPGLFADWAPTISTLEPPLLLAEDAPDLAQIAGQEHVKRALEVAATGGHSLVLVGPPGCGKSLLARALGGLLPPLSAEEAQELRQNYIHRGLVIPPWLAAQQRPFAWPAPTIAPRKLIDRPRCPGVLFFARHGVLGLDRLDQFVPEFSACLSAVLDRPTGQNIQFLLTLQPCPCGYYGDPLRECACPAERLLRYEQRTRGLIERLPLVVELGRLDYEKIASTRPAESSSSVRARVLTARQHTPAQTQCRPHLPADQSGVPIGGIRAKIAESGHPAITPGCAQLS